MRSLDQIKETIRRLLAVAENDASFEQEVETAIRSARQLMSAYQLSREDVSGGGGAGDVNVSAVQFDSCEVPYIQGGRKSCWEVSAAYWACEMVETAKFYTTRTTRRDSLGKPRLLSLTVFYGPAEDASFAADLLSEVQEVVATIARHRYGSVFRGDGGAFSEGFVEGLRSQLREAKRKDQEASAESRGLIVVQDQRALAIQEAATSWLAEEKGVRLRRGGGLSGARSGSGSARSEGRAAGRKYSPGARRSAGRLS